MNKFLTTLESIWQNPLIQALTYLVIAIATAFVAAFIVKRLFGLLGLDKKFDSLGINEGQRGTALKFIGKLVFLIVFLLFLPAVLERLGLQGISDPITDFVSVFIAYIPKLIAAAIVLAVGVLIATVVCVLLNSLLTKLKADEMTAKFLPKQSGSLSVTSFIIGVVRTVIILFAIAESVKILDLEILSSVAETIISYIPTVIKASLIGIAALVGASAIENSLGRSMPDGKIAVKILKSIIYVVAVFMILSQLDFAPTIVNYAFVITLTALAVAFAIAFGIGGKDFAKKTLEKIDPEKKKNGEK